MRARWLIGLCLVLLVGGLGLAGTLGARSVKSTDTIPTWPVQRVDFAHRVTAEGNLEAVKSTKVSVPMSTEPRQVIAWVAEDGSFVAKDEIVVRFDRSEFERKLEDGKGQLATASNMIKKDNAETGAELRNLDRDIISARMKLDASRDFQPIDEEIFSRQEIIEGRIDEELARARTEHAETNRTRRDAEARKQADILNIEKRKADTAIQRAEGGLTATEVLAPHDGILQLSRRRGNLLRAGDTVWQGQELAKIPDLNSMEAAVHVLEADAGGLEEGLAAKLIVEAHPELEFEAVVKRVDNLAKARVRGVPVHYFGVTLELGLTDPKVMKPGQRVRAILELENREDVIVVPRQAVFEQENGDKIAWVRSGEGFESRVLELGPGTPGRIVVESGLGEGDVVALQEPEAAGAES